MNFFKLYIGDYQRDTAHLSVTEHGAYLLMLQHYYATEKPLPIGKALHRMLRAQDKAERDAIDTVAAEFWRVTNDGLVNDRADAEITKAGAQAETNRAIAQAREAKRKAAREGNDKSTNRATNDQPNHSQTPDTRHQTKTHTETSPPPMARDLAEPEPQAVQPTQAGHLCRVMRRAGIADTNPGHPELIALAEAGATDAEVEGAARTAVERGKGFAYAVGTLKRQRIEAAQTAQQMHHGALPQRPPTQTELNALAHGFATGAYGPFDPANPGTTTQQPEVVDVEPRLIAP